MNPKDAVPLPPPIPIIHEPLHVPGVITIRHSEFALDLTQDQELKYKEKKMFETSMFLELLEKLCERCYKNSESKGFWNTDPATGGNPDNGSVPTKIALMHSELSEMLEAYRKGNPVCTKTFNTPDDPRKHGKPITILVGPEGGRPITEMEEEIADLFIRLCDFCGKFGIDLGRITLAKMEYNATRPQMHGGKKC